MQAESDFGIRLAEVSGGNLRNAIPRESYAVLLLPSAKTASFEKFVKSYEKMYRAEFAETEPDLSFSGKKTEKPLSVMNKDDQFAIIRAVFACPNGVQRMSQAMKGLVETSNNLAMVKCAKGKFEAHNLCRSSVDSSKEATAWRIAGVFQLGCKSEISVVILAGSLIWHLQFLKQQQKFIIRCSGKCLK